MFELRSGTATPAVTELVVMPFTWESNHYGYSEWIRGTDWTFTGFEPNTHNPDGYSRPEGVEFTARVEHLTGLRVRVTFFYANRSLFVREAVREG
jgi:hypothetical protein